MSGTKDDGAHSKVPRPFPRWKKCMLAAAAGLVAVGAALQVPALLQEGGAGRNVAQDPRTRVSTEAETSDFQRSHAESWELPTALTEESAGEGPGTLGEWSPSLIKGGFGFFLGFCVGYALRTFFRIGAVVIGVALIVFLGLSYAGVLPPFDWAAIEGPFNRLAETFRQQASGFKTFLAGDLPSAGLSGLGVFTGIKKN